MNSKFPLARAIRWACLLPALLWLASCNVREVAAPASVCSTLDATVNRHLVEAALNAYEGEVQDKTAVQQGTRLGLINQHLLTMQIHLQLLAQNRCPARSAPLDPAAYAAAAQNCYLSRLQASAASLEDKPAAARSLAEDKARAACDFGHWTAR
jgi:hypothetical protein